MPLFYYYSFLLAHLGLKAYITYPLGKPGYQNLVREIITPALQSQGISTVSILESVDSPGTKIYDTVYKSIRECNLMIADISEKNNNVSYEVGLAHAWGKNTLLLTSRPDLLPFDFASNHGVIVYDRYWKDEKERLRQAFERQLSRFLNSRPEDYDTTLLRYIDVSETFSIQVLEGNPDPVQVFDYFKRILELFQNETDTRFFFTEFQISSAKGIFSTSLEAITTIVKKIAYAIPNWRKIKAESLKLEAEAEKTLAEARKIGAETDTIRSSMEIERAAAMLKIFEDASILGLTNIKIGNEIQFNIDKDRVIQVQQVQLSEDSENEPPPDRNPGQ